MTDPTYLEELKTIRLYADYVEDRPPGFHLFEELLDALIKRAEGDMRE